MENLIKNSRNLIKSIKLKNKRYLYEKIDFSEKMIGIIGQRGVGKTTIMLQFLKEKDKKSESIYFSADDIYFLENSLKKTVEVLYYDYGIKVFCIDEIHKYRNWNQELKNIYDLLPDIQIIFSGSSSLDISSGLYDLSRRVVVYNLNGLSFREFVQFKTDKKFKVISADNLFQKYKSHSLKISSEVDVLKLFKDYLELGYYPYFLEGKKQTYYLKMENALNKTIYEDIANLNNIKSEHLYLFKRILNFLSSISPGEINTNRLSSNLGIAFETTESYLDIMHKISLIRYLLKDKRGYKLIRKAEKIFLDNTNVMMLINEKLGLEKNIGSLRELFVLNQLQNSEQKVFSAEKKGDFIVKVKQEKITLEIGGKSKKFSQISKIKNSFLIIDNIEIAEQNKIPLYLLGFLY